MVLGQFTPFFDVRAYRVYRRLVRSRRRYKIHLEAASSDKRKLLKERSVDLIPA